MLRMPKIPQNAGVGGSVPVYDEVIVNMRRMDSIIDFDPLSGVLTSVIEGSQSEYH